jgi:hypothetical protein
MIVWTLVISVAGPIDKAMPYFRMITAVYSIITIFSVVGICTYLNSTGLEPNR